MKPPVLWPANRFYWALLDAPGLARTGVLPKGLLPALEEDAPTDAGDLHAVYVTLSDGRLLVCAIEKSALSGISSEAFVLAPETLPPSLTGLGAGPEQFNLLVGAFEPRPIRRARLKRHAIAAAAVLLCGLLIAVGLHRRTQHWRERAQMARSATMSLAIQLGADTTAELTLEAVRARAARDALAQAAPPPDASLALMAVLQAWPASVPSKPQAISVTPSGVSISVSVEGDPAAFLKAFTPPPGWKLNEPRLNAVNNVTRLALQLQQVGGTR